MIERVSGRWFTRKAKWKTRKRKLSRRLLEDTSSGQSADQQQRVGIHIVTNIRMQGLELQAPLMGAGV